jgi:hypothetical protein
LEPVLEDTTGSGITAVQLAKKATGFAVSFGRTGLRVDFPTTEAPIAQAEIGSGDVRPTIMLYAPWDIINWRTKLIGNKTVLILVVVREEVESEDDGFESKLISQWRVMRLQDDGTLRVEIWKIQNGTTQQAIPANQIFFPVDANGDPLREIPFTFIGSDDNDSEIDDPPLYDMAELNLAHYRNSADYEDSSFKVGQPTPVFTGLTQDWVTTVLKGQVEYGSTAAVPLPVGATAMLLQAQPNTLPYEAMQLKEKQMVALGAKLVENKQVQRTATEATNDEQTSNSILATCANNVSAGFQWALKFCMKFIGGDDTTIEFKLNTDFAIAKLAPDEQAMIISQWQDGAITFDEMRAQLNRSGIATEDNEEARKKIEADQTAQLQKQTNSQIAIAQAKVKAGVADPNNPANPNNPPPPNPPAN